MLVLLGDERLLVLLGHGHCAESALQDAGVSILNSCAV